MRDLSLAKTRLEFLSNLICIHSKKCSAINQPTDQPTISYLTLHLYPFLSISFPIVRCTAYQQQRTNSNAAVRQRLLRCGAGGGQQLLTSGNSASASKKNTSRRNAWGNLSYADLITQAITSASETRLTLSQIYEWMVQNVPYFKDKGDSNSSAGWKVSD